MCLTKYSMLFNQEIESVLRHKNILQILCVNLAVLMCNLSGLMANSVHRNLIVGSMSTVYNLA